MNANHSFRTSITVLTVATIVGCAVMLFSGVSQFRLRTGVSDKALISAANQKLHNRFGEFYPAEARPAATKTVAEPQAIVTSNNAIHNASQRNTFEELVTTTSAYEEAEVTTSWSSGTVGGVPQVSVPVTINVNNGELMAQLIQTRESLAELKAHQAAIREDQRVFSYKVHSHEKETSAQSNVIVSAESSKTTAATKSAHSISAASGDSESHAESTGRVTSRMRTASETHAVPTAQTRHTGSTPADDAGQKSLVPPKPQVQSHQSTSETTAQKTQSEFRTQRTEELSETTNPEMSLEEEVSFESISIPEPSSDDSEDAAPVPEIEPISYNLDESGVQARKTVTAHRVSTQEENVVNFASLEEMAADEAPASLPQLNFGEPGEEEAPGNELEFTFESIAPSSNVDDKSAKASSNQVASHPTTPVPEVPQSAFFVAEEATESAASFSPVVEASDPEAEPMPSRRREQLLAAFAAVRGLPPEDLFRDDSEPFVEPIEPAEPVNEVSAAAQQLADASKNVGRDSSAASIAGSPPMITFADSTNQNLTVHVSSAAAPVELEFGEPSGLHPSMPQGAPGHPELPAMSLAEQKAEPWHKYRSRIHLRGRTPAASVGPSSPVPEVPAVARTQVPEIPAIAAREPVPAPPSLEESNDHSVADSGFSSQSEDRSISDSPLMIPDAGGRIDVAQKESSDKLSSIELPPLPELAKVPELAPVPEMNFQTDLALSEDNSVYEPQPVMDRMGEVASEMHSSPLFAQTPPVMAPRRMPEKNSGKLPFQTTFRRINKRVAWMADTMGMSDNEEANQPSPRPQMSTPQIPQAAPQPPTRKRSHGIVHGNPPMAPRGLPKLNVPKFTVQSFSLPQMNFRPMQAPSLQLPALDTPDWLACPPDVMAPVRNSNAVHRVLSTMQFAGQPKTLN